MAQWQVKEFAKLTDVTVRTLHHYDIIGLLKPSMRLDNGYRIYTEKDLLKFQQILALKFFGFDLAQIEELLDKNQSLIDVFTMQSNLLQQKAAMILNASKALKDIIASDDSGKIVWEQVIESIKVYKTMEHLEKGWAGQILDAQEIKDYAEFKENLKFRYTLEDKKSFEIKWHGIVEQIRLHVQDDPSSEIGFSIAHDCLEMMIAFYGEKYAHLRRAIWKKGFRTNKISDQHGLTPEMVAWLDAATHAYYATKIKAIFMQIQDMVTPEIKLAWENLMDEMCGDSQAIRKKIIKQALKVNTQYPREQQLNSTVVDWLKSL